MVFKFILRILSWYKKISVIVLCGLIITTGIAEQIVFTSFGRPCYSSLDFTPYGPNGEYPGMYLVKYDTSTHEYSGYAVPQTTMIYHGGNEVPGIAWNASNTVVDKYMNLEYLVGRIQDDSIVVDPRFDPSDYGLWKALGWSDDGYTLYALCYDVVDSELVLTLKRLSYYSDINQTTYHVFRPNQVFTGMCFAYNASGLIAQTQNTYENMQIVVSNGEKEKIIDLVGGHDSVPICWLDDNTLLYWDSPNEESTSYTLMVYYWDTDTAIPFKAATGDEIMFDEETDDGWTWFPWYDMTISSDKKSVALFIVCSPGSTYPVADIAIISLSDASKELLHPWNEDYDEGAYRDIDDTITIQAPYDLYVDCRIRLNIAYLN